MQNAEKLHRKKGCFLDLPLGQMRFLGKCIGKIRSAAPARGQAVKNESLSLQGAPEVLHLADGKAERKSQAIAG